MQKTNLNLNLGPLTLNRDTVMRLAVKEPSKPGMKPSEDRTKTDCPASTKTRVTAHCC